MLPGSDSRYVRVEISFETSATLLGKEGQNIGTYEVFERIPGQLYGEGRGIILFGDGSSAIWNGHGVGRGTEDGGIAFAVAVSFQTDAADLARLNEVLAPRRAPRPRRRARALDPARLDRGEPLAPGPGYRSRVSAGC